MQNTTQYRDSPNRYGIVSRCLHWLMTLVFLWQFGSAIVHLLAKDTPLDEFMWGLHKSVGTLLMLLIVLRILWAIVNAGRRPPSVSGWARSGHMALYALMLLIPLVALIRQYGSGKAFAPFGLPFMPGFEGNKVEWMTDLGSNFHSLMAWILLAMIVGHIAAALWHRAQGHKDVYHRMIGGTTANRRAI